MSWARVLAARLRGLLERHRLERELDDEVRFHLEMQIEDNLETSMNPVEARHAALRSFGAIEPMKERYRERWAFALVETTAQDIRYAVRTLRKSPGFTVLVLGLVGALGVGRVGRSLLFGVTATDPPTFVAVSLLLTAVATAACYPGATRNEGRALSGIAATLTS